MSGQYLVAHTGNVNISGAQEYQNRMRGLGGNWIPYWHGEPPYVMIDIPQLWPWDNPHHPLNATKEGAD